MFLLPSQKSSAILIKMVVVVVVVVWAPWCPLVYLEGSPRYLTTRLLDWPRHPSGFEASEVYNGSGIGSAGAGISPLAVLPIKHANFGFRTANLTYEFSP